MALPFKKKVALIVVFICASYFSIAVATTYAQYSFNAKIVARENAPDDATPEKFSFPKQIIVLVDGYCARDKAISKLERSSTNANAIIISSEKGYTIQLLDEFHNEYWIAVVNAMNDCYSIEHALAHRGISGWTNIEVILS